MRSQGPLTHSVATGSPISTRIVSLVALIQNVKVTGVPSYPWWTDTLKGIPSHWLTHSIIQAGSTAAGGYFNLTQLSTVRFRAATDGLGLPTLTASSIFTRVTFTKIDFFTAVSTFKNSKILVLIYNSRNNQHLGNHPELEYKTKYCLTT